MAGDEDAAGDSLDVRFAPVGVLSAEPGGLELPCGIVEGLSDFEPPVRGHLPNETSLNGFRGRHGRGEEKLKVES